MSVDTDDSDDDKEEDEEEEDGDRDNDGVEDGAVLLDMLHQKSPETVD